jgi:fatty acid desaturase
MRFAAVTVAALVRTTVVPLFLSGAVAYWPLFLQHMFNRLASSQLSQWGTAKPEAQELQMCWLMHTNYAFST